MTKTDKRHLLNTIILLFSIVLIGTSGYMVLEGFSFIDALFMTIISVSTVGYEIIEPLSDAGKIFTVILIVMSLGVFAYGLGTLTRFVFEGIFRNYYKQNKVKKKISMLSGHVIVCGYGRVGKQATTELQELNEKIVVIDVKDEVIQKLQDGSEFLYIHGDATQEEILMEAHIDQAKALITTFPNDADNLFVVLTARQMNSKITIISRAYDIHSDVKLKRAGANNVIMPDKVGGQRMAKLVSQPDVVEFIEYLMLQSNREVTIEELSCTRLSSCFANKSIRELDIRNKSGSNIIGLRRADGSYIINPSPEILLTHDDKLFVLGDRRQINKLNELLHTAKE
ncbi:MAG: potassium channel protein [Bacteroidota bacterium]